VISSSIAFVAANDLDELGAFKADSATKFTDGAGDSSAFRRLRTNAPIEADKGLLVASGQRLSMSRLSRAMAKRRVSARTGEV